MWFRESKYAWMMLAFLWIFNFFGSLSRFATGYFQNAIVNDLGVSHSFVSACWSLNMLIAAICMPLGGMLVDRFGPKRVMATSALASGIGMGMINLIPNWIGFLIGFGIVSGLMGIGATTSYVLMLGWFKNHRAKAMAILSSAGALGIAVLAPIFSAGPWITWDNVYFVASLISLCLITPVILLAIKDPKKDEAADGKPAEKKPSFFKQIGELARILRHPVILIVGFALFACGYNMSTVDAHLVAIHEHNHVSLAIKTTALSILGLVEVAGSLMFGYLLDKMSRSLALASLYFVRSISFIALMLTFDVSPIIFSLLFGASFLGAIPGGMLVAGEATESEGNGQAGSQIGVLLLLHQLGGVLGALTGGVVVDLTGSYNILVILNISLAFLSAVGYFYVHKRLRKPTSKVENAVA